MALGVTRRALAAVTLLAAGLAPGCVAVALPRGLNDDERALLGRAPRIGVCEVLPKSKYERDASALLAESLRTTSLFTEVRLVEAPTDPAAWTVRVDSLFGGSFCGGSCWGPAAFVMAFSAGIIPVFGDAPSMYEFVVTPPGRDGAKPRKLNLSDERFGLCGWLAIPLRLMPWWFMQNNSPRQVPPIADRLAAEIARMRIEGSAR